MSERRVLTLYPYLLNDSCWVFDVDPRPHGVGIRDAVGEPTLELGSLPRREGRCLHIAHDAIPDRFGDLETLFDAEAIEPEL